MFDTTRTAATITANTTALFEALRRVKHAISQDETLYYLRGVYMHVDAGKLVFVATDGYRLARNAIDFGEDSERLVPAPVILPEAFVLDVLKIKKTAKHWDCRLEITADRVRFYVPVQGGEPALVECKPIEGTYPDYKMVIPRANERAYTLNTEAVLETMAAFAAMGAAVAGTRRDARAPTKFTFNGAGEVTLECKIKGITAAAKHELIAEPEGEFVVGVSARYVRDTLKSFAGPSVVLRFSDNGSPIVLEGDTGLDTGFLAVIMPCRV